MARRGPAGPGPGRSSPQDPVRQRLSLSGCRNASLLPPWLWSSLLLDRLDVALLCRFLVARIQEGIRDDGEQQHHALDEILPGVGDVHDGHTVEHRSDNERADDDVEHAATAA